jgi:hypothetical protein
MNVIILPFSFHDASFLPNHIIFNIIYFKLKLAHNLFYNSYEVKEKLVYNLMYDRTILLKTIFENSLMI